MFVVPRRWSDRHIDPLTSDMIARLLKRINKLRLQKMTYFVVFLAQSVGVESVVMLKGTTPTSLRASGGTATITHMRYERRVDAIAKTDSDTAGNVYILVRFYGTVHVVQMNHSF